MNIQLFEFRQFNNGMTSVSGAIRSALQELAAERICSAQTELGRAHDSLSSHGLALAHGGRMVKADVASLVTEAEALRVRAFNLITELDAAKIGELLDACQVHFTNCKSALLGEKEG
jgi:hypothetical protein